jgi:hypothetical protein
MFSWGMFSMNSTTAAHFHVRSPSGPPGWKKCFPSFSSPRRTFASMAGTLHGVSSASWRVLRYGRGDSAANIRRVHPEDEAHEPRYGLAYLALPCLPPTDRRDRGSQQVRELRLRHACRFAQLPQILRSHGRTVLTVHTNGQRLPAAPSFAPHIQRCHSRTASFSPL